MKKSIFWLFGLFPFVVLGQNIELGMTSGFSFYSGDLSSIHFQNFTNNAAPAIGLYAKTRFDVAYNIRVQTNYTRLTARNLPLRPDRRQFEFRTPLWETFLALDINLFKLAKINGQRFHPFLFVGFGMFHFNPQGKVNGDFINLQPLGTEGQGIIGQPEKYHRFETVIPFGGGLVLNVNAQTSIMLELGLRNTFTDYLDDISHTQVDYLTVLQYNGSQAAHFSNPAISPLEPQQMKYRRGGIYKDWYYTATISLGYRPKFDQKKKKARKGRICPKF